MSTTFTGYHSSRRSKTVHALDTTSFTGGEFIMCCGRATEARNGWFEPGLTKSKITCKQCRRWIDEHPDIRGVIDQHGDLK